MRSYSDGRSRRNRRNDKELTFSIGSTTAALEVEGHGDVPRIQPDVDGRPESCNDKVKEQTMIIL